LAKPIISIGFLYFSEKVLNDEIPNEREENFLRDIFLGV
jgi:hypothetical protein